jgi:predicted GIY-YIG superfamily endonuclease
MWSVYLLRCGDGTLYAGITNDLRRRLAAHTKGRGARYTRGRGPLRLVHCEIALDRSAALRRELALKRMPRAAKLAFLAAPVEAVHKSG